MKLDIEQFTTTHAVKEEEGKKERDHRVQEYVLFMQ